MNDKQLATDDQPDDVDNAFDLGSGIDDDLEISAPTASDKNGKLWLYLGLGAFLGALLLRLVLGPILDAQRQRNEQVGEILKQVELTNSAANQALSAAGNFDDLERNMVDLGAQFDTLVVPKKLSQKAANSLFNNSENSAEVVAQWDSYRSSAEQLLAQGPRVSLLKDKLFAVNGEIAEVTSDTISFVDAVAKEGRSRRNDSAKDRYLFLTSEAANLNGILSRLSAGMGGYFLPNVNLQKLSDSQNSQILRLKDTLSRITGNAAAVVATAAEPLQTKFSSIESSLSEIADGSQSVSTSRSALRAMRARSPELNNAVVATTNQSASLGAMSAANNFLPLLLFGLGIYGLWRFSKSQSRDLVESEGTLSDALAEQQESILKLLDEMSALADGDLTVEAEVTDQITGAIADSVNFAVIEMRELVSQINRASVEVANESELAVSNAQSVSLSNMQQADQITSAASEMQRVTTSMREMSEQAQSSFEMAAESMQAANQGAQAVRDTITGMDAMREQIQDTSKRIKRLGESSQRIGDIVALIDDIAEQTNILSLNAAIQASMAGEAGRGFAVVSDEVQSLAERSTEATKKIGELVTTIQNDTNDAVKSMEKATQQVISGTKVADSAGSALAEIENVSARLSSLIEAISKRSSEQAHIVTSVAEKVTLVSDSSADTSRKAQDSANSIAKLLELAKELETSVSRFKLPAS